MIEIQEQGLAELAATADELKTKALRLIAEIERDHWPIDVDEAWRIAFGEKPCFVAFTVKGYLQVLIDDILSDLASMLGDASTVTDDALVTEWQEIWKGKGKEPPIVEVN